MDDGFVVECEQEFLIVTTFCKTLDDTIETVVLKPFFCCRATMVDWLMEAVMVDQSPRIL